MYRIKIVVVATAMAFAMASIGHAADKFGVGEEYPEGLAALNGVLYMVGWGDGTEIDFALNGNRLYTLDTRTGVATRVDNGIDFGLNEDLPTGLAAIGDTLYMVGLSTDALYTIDISTGKTSRVGNVEQFGIRGNSPKARGLAAIGDTLYMVGEVTTVRDILKKIGNSSPREQGVDVAENTLPAEATSALYTLDTSTGVATRVGNAEGFGVATHALGGLANIGETLAIGGLAAIGDTLYMIGTRSFQETEGIKAGGYISYSILYTIDTTTGIATIVSEGFYEIMPVGLAALNGTLYMVGRRTNALYTIDTNTGEETLVELVPIDWRGGYVAAGTNISLTGSGFSDVTGGISTRVGGIFPVLDWYFPAGGAIAVDLLFGDSPSELISNIYAQILFSPFSFIFGPVLFGVSINGGVSLSTIRSEYAYGSLTLELMIAIDNHSRIYARGGVGTGASATDFSVPIEVGYLWWF